GTRNIFYEIKGASGADEVHPAPEVIRAAKVLMVDPWGEIGMVRAARIAREAGIPVVSDIERQDFDNFETLFALIDHVVISLDFALELTGAQTPEEAATRLWNDNREAVIVTCGADGCYAIARE